VWAMKKEGEKDAVTYAYTKTTWTFLEEVDVFAFLPRCFFRCTHTDVAQSSVFWFWATVVPSTLSYPHHHHHHHPIIIIIIIIITIITTTTTITATIPTLLLLSTF
jgi:hypothetical protein